MSSLVADWSGSHCDVLLEPRPPSPLGKWGAGRSLRRLVRYGVRHRIVSICFVTLTLFFTINGVLLLLRLCNSRKGNAIYNRFFGFRSREKLDWPSFQVSDDGFLDLPEKVRLDYVTKALQESYFEECSESLTPQTIRQLDMVWQISQSTVHDSILVGTEMWNQLSLEEIFDPFRYYADDKVEEFKFPFTILSYGKRLEQGMKLLSRIGAEDVDYVSYPSIEMAWDNRDYLSKYLFKKASNMTRDEFMSEFSGKNAGYLLSTLNQWMVFERMTNGTYPDEVIVFEDDIFTVPDFQRKFQVLQSQLSTVPWEMVFAGTCFRIHSEDRVTPNLCRANTTRCFNAVLIRKSAAEKILTRGAFQDDFVPVDHMFNTYIVDLEIPTYFVYPPLAYEQSKTGIHYPCLKQ